MSSCCNLDYTVVSSRERKRVVARPARDWNQIWAVSWKAKFMPELENRSKKNIPGHATAAAPDVSWVEGSPGVAGAYYPKLAIMPGKRALSSNPLFRGYDAYSEQQKKNMFGSGKQQIPACQNIRDVE